MAEAKAESAQVVVTADDLDQWTEDAITQGLTPAWYIYGVLTAALSGETDV